MKLRPKPQTRPIRWDIYRAAAKARLIGMVTAPDAETAIKIAAEEYKIWGRGARRRHAHRGCGGGHVEPPRPADAPAATARECGGGFHDVLRGGGKASLLRVTPAAMTRPLSPGRSGQWLVINK